MNKRLNEKMTALFLTGVVAVIAVAPQANAVGISKKAQKVEHSEYYEAIYPISIQPKRDIKEISIETLVAENNATKEQDKKRAEAERILKEQQKQQEKELKAKLAEEKRIAIIKQNKENFLLMIKQKDITGIDLRTPSGLSSEDIEKILEGTKFAGLGAAFAKAEEKYHINAYYLIAHAAWESSWGTSKLAKNKNNLFGFAAYDNSAYKSATKFNTKEDCIYRVAEFVNEHYLDEDGDHYNGPTLKGMNKKYASDEQWANGIASVIKSLVNRNTQTL
ncbi:putative endo-beta-N-acetylglucosaminidase precursor [compost metagenome]